MSSYYENQMNSLVRKIKYHKPTRKMLSLLLK